MQIPSAAPPPAPWRAGMIAGGGLLGLGVFLAAVPVGDSWVGAEVAAAALFTFVGTAVLVPSLGLPATRPVRLAVGLGAALLLAFAAAQAQERISELELWDATTRADHAYDYERYLARSRILAHEAEARRLKDERSFTEARLTGSAKALRAFRQEFPRSPRAAKARELIRAMYAEAEAGYAKAAPTARPEAAAGMRALLEALRESDDATVGVCFAPAEGLEDAAIAEDVARRLTGSRDVVPVGPAFSAEKARVREVEVVRAIGQAFRKVFPASIFELKHAAPGAPGPRLLVRARVTANPARVYHAEADEGKPPAQRRYWIGIEVDLEATVAVAPQPNVAHQVLLHAVPAPNFSVSRDFGKSLDPGAVYDRMADTAFDDLAAGLATAFGVPTRSRSLPPEPPPDLRPPWKKVEGGSHAQWPVLVDCVVPELLKANPDITVEAATEAVIERVIEEGIQPQMLAETYVRSALEAARARAEKVEK